MIAASVIQQRRAGIVAFTLIELLILMVFAAILFAMAIESEVNMKASELEIELRRANARIDALEQEKRDWMLERQGLLDRIAELELRLDQYRLADGSFVEAGALKKYISNLRPACEQPGDFAFDARLLKSGEFRITRRSWAMTAEGRRLAASIPGLEDLLGAGTVGTSVLRKQGRRMFDHSESRTVKCRYRVDASEDVQHEDLQLYLRQIDELRKYFYVKAPRNAGL